MKVGDYVRYIDPMKRVLGIASKKRAGAAKVLRIEGDIAVIDFGVEGHRAVKVLTSDLRPSRVVWTWVENL